ncbi:MAG: hypothetical protein WA446_18785 [Steroidobacteraceae bacterium]
MTEGAQRQFMPVSSPEMLVPTICTVRSSRVLTNSLPCTWMPKPPVGVGVAFEAGAEAVEALEWCQPRSSVCRTRSRRRIDTANPSATSGSQHAARSSARCRENYPQAHAGSNRQFSQ